MAVSVYYTQSGETFTIPASKSVRFDATEHLIKFMTAMENHNHSDGRGRALTSAKVVTALNDTNNNEWIKVTATGSAVNEVTIANAATGNAPTISATGDDTNIDLKLAGKGTGMVQADSSYGAWTTDTDGATVTFNMATTNKHRVTLAGNRTLAVSNVKTGQCFLIRLLQDGTGSRTVTWFATISWPNASVPTLTTTASKADVFLFVCTGAGTYDGFVVGQNL